MSATIYLAGKVLDHIVGKTAYTMPTVYVGLYTANPTSSGAQTNEAAWAGYARQATSGATWAAASGGANNNAVAIVFPAKTGGTDQTVTHWATFDASTAGNMLNFGPMVSAQLIQNATVPNIPIGNAPQSLA